MKNYYVTCTLIYNGSVEVEAESEDEAMEKAEAMMNERRDDTYRNDQYVGSIPFIFGEATVDYADEA